MVSLAMILHDHGSLGKILARSCQDLGKHTHASWQACQDSCHWVCGTNNLLKNTGHGKRRRTPCIYCRKDAPKPINLERSGDWLKKKDQPRNNKGEFRSPNKNAEKEIDLELSTVSGEDLDCYNKSDGKSVPTNSRCGIHSIHDLQLNYIVNGYRQRDIGL